MESTRASTYLSSVVSTVQNKRQAPWPNPQDSVGPYLQRMGIIHCWEARGPARDKFTQLAEAISAFLSQCNDSPSAPVTWSLHMTGRTKETSRPTIVFCSNDLKARRTIRGIIKDSGLLQHYPGFITLDCNRPPGFQCLKPLAGRDDRQVVDIECEKSRETMSAYPGTRLFVHQPEDVRSPRLATAGSVIQWQDRYFFITVAHVFAGCNNSVFPVTEPHSQFEFDMDDCGDYDDLSGDDSPFSEALSDASKTSRGLGMSHSISTRLSSFISQSTTDRQNLGDETKPASSLVAIEGSSSQRASKDALISASSGKHTSSDTKSSMLLSETEMGLHVLDNWAGSRIEPRRSHPGTPLMPLISSSDGARGLLDYALIEIDTPDLNVIEGNSTYTVKGVSKIPNCIDVIAITASHGVLHGRMSGTSTFMYAPSSSYHEELWTVMLEKKLTMGDCGSIVMGVDSGIVYGHIVAGSEDSGFAYIVPLRDIFFDLRQRFGGTWEQYTPASDIRIRNSGTAVTSQKPLYNSNSSPLRQDLAVSQPVSQGGYGATLQSSAVDTASHMAHVQEFIEWVRDVSEKYQMRGGQSFIPFSELRSYLGTYRVEKLLDEVLLTDMLSTAHMVPTIRSSYLRVFAILLNINKGHLIKELICEPGLSDLSLPIQGQHEKSKYLAGKDSLFWNSFARKQWLFCAQPLDDTPNLEILPDYILPIIESDYLYRGGSAEVYRIRIHEGYNMLKLKTHSHNESYALKVLHGKESEALYKNEVAAFKLLRQFENIQDLIPGYHTSFIYGNTMNLVLEYADQGNLEQYLHTMSPPGLTVSINSFWNNLFGVVKALNIIHNPPFTGSQHQRQIHGYHHDIKPENILVTYRRDSQSPAFKLADFGLVRFTNVSKSSSLSSKKHNYGTRTYSPPEFHSNGHQNIDHSIAQQAADIFALGCVIIEVATWLTMSRQGLSTYRQRLRQAARRHNLDGDYCFHDGFSVLPLVRETHQAIIQHTSSNHLLTRRILETLIDGMLDDATYRLSAASVLQMFGEVYIESTTTVAVRDASIPALLTSVRSSESVTIRSKNWHVYRHEQYHWQLVLIAQDLALLKISFSPEDSYIGCSRKTKASRLLRWLQLARLSLTLTGMRESGIYEFDLTGSSTLILASAIFSKSSDIQPISRSWLVGHGNYLGCVSQNDFTMLRLCRPLGAGQRMLGSNALIQLEPRTKIFRRMDQMRYKFKDLYSESIMQLADVVGKIIIKTLYKPWISTGWQRQPHRMVSERPNQLWRPNQNLIRNADLSAAVDLQARTRTQTTLWQQFLRRLIKDHFNYSSHRNETEDTIHVLPGNRYLLMLRVSRIATGVYYKLVERAHYTSRLTDTKALKSEMDKAIESGDVEFVPL